MARDDPKFMLRMPPEVKERVEAAAKAAGRSINAEIVHRLTLTFGGEHWVEQVRGKSDEDLGRAIQHMEEAARRMQEMMNSVAAQFAPPVQIDLSGNPGPRRRRGPSRKPTKD